MRSYFVALLTAVIVSLAVGAHAEQNPVRHRPKSQAVGSAQRFIVKLRAAPVSSAPEPLSAQNQPDRISTLAARTRISLKAHREITSLLHVVEVEPAVTGESAAQMLARLRADSSVEYVEVDQRRYPHAAPSNSLYSQQWYLMPSSSTNPAAIDAQTAWDTTTGSSSLVIADIDSGVRADHPNLAARLLTGYCFISDSFVANVANTSYTCPGPGAWDPGDGISSSDIASNPNECGSGSSAASPEYSSWHGTRVASILGADQSYSAGMVGVTWGPKILPVRALGRCGGVDSDIITGMLWAAGIPVTVQGTQTQLTNPNPAKIINMSLGGSGSCPQSYQDTINQLMAIGVVVVASAGNEGGPVDAPANCTGVVAVAGLRNAGTKVGYSSLGPQVAVGAPAGNCINNVPLYSPNSLPCQDQILTAVNLGKQTADANDYTSPYWCDSSTDVNAANCPLTNSNQYRTYSLGTSFSAPMVSGITALMSSVNSKLNSCEMLSRVKEGALAYPQSSSTTTTMCHVPNGSNDVQGGECICTTDGKTCGVGMANAPGALQAALRPIAAVSVPSSVTAGQGVTLSGTGSAAANNSSISTYEWANTGSHTLTISGAATATATVTAPSCGIGTVRLTVTDGAGRTDTADVVISTTSATTTAPASASGSASCSLTTPAEQIAVCPATLSIQASSAGQSFTADVVYATDTSVNWEVNGVAGGSSTVGTISTSGLYTPPANVPSPSTVTLTAISVADSTKSASAQVTITPPPKGGGSMDWLTLIGLGIFTGSGALRALRGLPSA